MQYLNIFFAGTSFEQAKEGPLSYQETSCGPLFDKTWIAFTEGSFVPSLVEIDPVILNKKMNMLKVYDNYNDNGDDDNNDNSAQVS